MLQGLYFDSAATAVPDVQIAQRALSLALEHFGNPSSLHTLGKSAAQQLNLWRDRAARALKVKEEQVVFTSGATEANQIVLLRLFLHKNIEKFHIVAATFEHASVHETLLSMQGAGASVSWVTPQATGHICVEDFVREIQPQTRFVTLMLVNNETGAIQPVQEIISKIRTLPTGQQVHVHVDATQVPGRLPLDFGQLDCDSACLSSHKIGGPRGAGILYIKKPIKSLFSSGGQEFQMRGGTENLFAIIGCVLALEKALITPQATRDNEQLWLSGLAGLGASFLPAERVKNPEKYSPTILSFAFPPLPGEVLTRLLSQEGVFVNTGSACGKEKKDRTRVLTCMGVSEKIAKCAVRVSFEQETPREKSIKAVEILHKIISTQKKVLNF